LNFFTVRALIPHARYRRLGDLDADVSGAAGANYRRALMTASQAQFLRGLRKNPQDHEKFCR